MVLTRVLEASGLREGHEYETGKYSGRRAKPHAAGCDCASAAGQDVVVDAKMTLVAYERYFNAEDKVTRDRAIDEHIAAIRGHIRLLSRKDYQQLPGLRSLDYVLMFIPVERRFCWRSIVSRS